MSQFPTTGWGNASQVVNQNVDPDTNKRRWWQEVGTVVDPLSDVICLVAPTRPGCPGDPNRPPDTVVTNVNTGTVPVWVYVALVLLGVGLLYVATRNK